MFAYEGWIVATSINAELKNPKKNLPLALVFGSLIVVAAYVFYFIGVAGGATTTELMDANLGAPHAFKNIFGGLQPSIIAASSIDFGIALIKPENINTESPAPNPQ